MSRSQTRRRHRYVGADCHMCHKTGPYSMMRRRTMHKSRGHCRTLLAISKYLPKWARLMDGQILLGSSDGWIVAEKRPGPGSQASSCILRVVQSTGLQRQTPAADATRQIFAQRLETGDTLIELVAPDPRHPLPICLGWCTLIRQCLQRELYFLQGQADRLGSPDNRDHPDRRTGEPPLVAIRPHRFDQPLRLVKPKSRSGDAAASCNVPDREHLGHWSSGAWCPRCGSVSQSPFNPSLRFSRTRLTDGLRSMVKQLPDSWSENCMDISPNSAIEGFYEHGAGVAGRETSLVERETFGHPHATGGM